MAKYMEIKLEKRNVSCVARLLEYEAPETCDIVWNALPITGENNRQYRWAISHTIDPRRDHGAPPNHTFWALRGYNGRNPGLCNTYTASSRAVG